MADQMSTATDEPQSSQGNPVLLTEGSFIDEGETSLLKQEESVIDILKETNQTITVKTQEAIEETLSEKLDKISIHEDEDEEPVYVSPVPDPYARAIRYMENHNVMQIFQKLTAEIIYHRPEDPLNHMLEELQKMKKERDVNSPPAATTE